MSAADRDEFDAMLAGSDTTARFILEELASLRAHLDGQPLAERVEGLARLCYFRGRADGATRQRLHVLAAANAPMGQVPL